MSTQLQHPLEEWDELAKENETLRNLDQQVTWTWEDKYIVSDFESLTPPKFSVTDQIGLLKTFYLIYFGEISTISNIGGLFLNIVVHTPSIFDETDTGIFKFSEKGKRPISGYTLPANLTDSFRRFKAQSTPEEEDPEVDNVPPPIEDVADGLVDDVDNDQNQAAGPSRPRPQVKEITRNDILAFKQAVIDAFNVLEELTEGVSATTAYRSLYHTAFFLILFMMRRITKRAEDLTSALSRANIHKHYTDMVSNPFGLTLPPPSTALNRSLDQMLSTANKSSRELYTVMLWLLQKNTASASDTPTGLLEMNNVGLEAVLRATCMTHIAGAGLPLVTLFVTVKALFNKTERDTLQWLAYPELVTSVRRIVRLRRSQCELLAMKSQIKLFPYCRLVNQNYHQELGIKGNELICYLMACLIDLRAPPELGTGGAKNAFWTNSLNSKLRGQIQDAARAMYEKSSGFVLTAQFEGQVSYNCNASTSNKWERPHVPAACEEEDEESFDDFVPM